MKPISNYVIIGFSFLVLAGTQASTAPEVKGLPYCDAEYVVSKIGKVKKIKITGCGPGKLFPKYKTRTKRFIKRLYYEAKTIDGHPVESTGMKVRVVFERKYYMGIKAVIFPVEQRESIPDEPMGHE